MKVVVTGGAGYVGWSVVRELLSRPEVDELVVYDNFSRHNYGLLLAEHGPEYRKCIIQVDDILNSRGLREAFKGADCVCHLAALALSPFSDSQPHFFDQVNHWGTAEVSYAAEDKAVPRIVHVSSGAVYGLGPEPFDHSLEPMPVTSYGASKLAGERQLARLSDKVETVVFRSGTVYGVNPAARFDTFINRFVLDASLRRPVQVHGSGEQHRPIIHVKTLAAIVADAVTGGIEPSTYDAVEANVSVIDVLVALDKVLPGFERIFMTQQQRMRDLFIRPDPRLSRLGARDYSIEKDLSEIFGQISLS